MIGRAAVLFGLIFALVWGVSFVPEAQAKRSILEILFPYHAKPDPASDDGGAEVEKTLKAPFTAPDPKEGGKKGAFDELYDPTGSAAAGSELAMPHRHHEQIARWLTKAVADSLTVEPETYPAHVESLSARFNPKALEQYQAFMRQSRTLQSLQNNKMILRNILEPPLLLNKAPLEGRYRWLFEIPATLTFLPQHLKSYENHNPITHKVLVRAQVGRIEAKEDDEMEVVIESFEIIRASE